MKHADWTHNSVLYQINVRQFSPAGHLSAVEAALPRLRNLGVDLLWFMPLQPIGRVNRKGSLGSNYSIRDYLTINPDFGTASDFRRLVDRAHGLGFRVILDWVANHTAWDHPWVAAHPDWYLKNAAGQIDSYVYDNGCELEYWTDVVGLDYRQPAVWSAMTEAMKFWLTEYDLDGFRCDVASLMPTAFWEGVRTELEAIKPVFMLAESFAADLHQRAFDATYDWGFYDLITAIRQGRKTGLDLGPWWEGLQRAYPADAYKLLFTTNHDKNAWVASDVELFGDSFRAFAVLGLTLPGLPLIYNGQEAGLARRLSFFETDPIDWQDYGLTAFYQEVLRLRRAHPCLWNGPFGGQLTWLPEHSTQLVAFHRQKAADGVTVVVNLSDQAQAFRGQTLPPWGYLTFSD